MTEAVRAVGYLRVPTRPPGEGARLETQDRKDLGDHVQLHRLDLLAVLVDRYGERRSGFPQLKAAIAQCRSRDAVLILPRTGSLLRDPLFFDLMLEADVDFRVLDASGLTRDTLASVGLRALRFDPRGGS